MNLDFALVVFCLTLVALVATARENDKVAQQATQALAEVTKSVIAWVKSVKK